MSRWFMILFLCSPSIHGDELGRLFTTAQQRMELDREARTPAPVGPQVEFQGLIQRRGNAIAWINGRAATIGQAVDGATFIGTDGTTGKLLIANRRTAVALKPGQLWTQGRAIEPVHKVAKRNGPR